MSVAFNQYDKFIFINGTWEKLNENVDKTLNDESDNAISNSAVTEKFAEFENQFPTIIDNLESTSRTSGLSANMGRELKELIGNVGETIDIINGEEI